jgi:RHS repeat-associated protein
VVLALKEICYYPGGMLMPGRKFSSGNYRYGFNGKEEDDEVKGDGNSLDFGARIYDSRLGRWLSVDPLQKNYPFASTYNFVLNNPILCSDPDGKIVKINSEVDYKRFEAFLSKMFNGKVIAKVRQTKDVWNPMNNTLILDIQTGSELSGIEKEAYDYIKKIIDNQNITLELGIKDKPYVLEDYNPDDFSANQFFLNRVEGFKDGFEIGSKGHWFMHYFIEQYGSQVAYQETNMPPKGQYEGYKGMFGGNPKSRYDGWHEYSLQEGLKILGFTWGASIFSNDKTIEKTDFYDKEKKYKASLIHTFDRKSKDVKATTDNKGPYLPSNTNDDGTNKNSKSGGRTYSYNYEED